MPKTGMTFTSETVVALSNCAVTMGSGDLEVFATPAMVALMENAAMNAVAPYLPEGSTTVGSEISVSHNRPTGIGAVVSATAELFEIEGRKLVFKVVAGDDAGLIGEGTHVRFVVDVERFMSKVASK